MLKKTVIAVILCCTAALAACSSEEENEDNSQFAEIFGPLLPSDTDPTETAPGGQEPGTGQNASTVERFNGFFSWDLDGLVIETAQPPSAGNFDSQLLVRAKSADGNLVCIGRTEFLSRDIGFNTAFTQFASNSGEIPDFNFISVDDFAGQNGPAKEFITFRIEDDGGHVNTIGHFYYFPAEQLTYERTTTYEIKCMTFASLYASNEARIRNILSNVKFQMGGPSN